MGCSRSAPTRSMVWRLSRAVEGGMVLEPCTQGRRDDTTGHTKNKRWGSECMWIIFLSGCCPCDKTAIQLAIEGVSEPHKCNRYSKLERHRTRELCVRVWFWYLVITLLEYFQCVHLSLKKGPNLENFHCFLCVVSVRETMNHEENYRDHVKLSTAASFCLALFNPSALQRSRVPSPVHPSTQRTTTQKNKRGQPRPMSQT